MPFLSVICPTMRVGGLNHLFDSLARQTYTDFELVLVDAFADRRRDLVTKEAGDRFLAVRHVGFNPSPFPVCSFSAYSNAGIMAATGEVLLFVVDYSQLPPDLIAKHAMFHKLDPTGRAGMMGPHRYVKLDVAKDFPKYGQADIDNYAADVERGRLDKFMWSIGDAVDAPSDPHRADGAATVQHDADPKLRMPPGLIGPEFYHAKNESIRRAMALEVDGYDTDLDGAHLYQDTDFADRLSTKAGVRWMLDPSAVIDIVNPRHVFPFAKRTRPHESNKAIWERKKAEGYSERTNRLGLLKVKEATDTSLYDGGVGMVTDTTLPRLRVAMVYGEFSSYGHGPYSVDGIYTRQGLTGSEGSFFNLARTLSERGHEVVVFCETQGEQDHAAGFKMLPLHLLPRFPMVQGVDAMLAWNEPDYLKFAPVGTVRICDQQLNDFGYAGGGWYAQAGRFIGPHVTPGWRTLVDHWVSPSENHRANVMKSEGIRLDDCSVVPNSVDLDLFKGGTTRNAHRAVWCSSPDRGLHHALSMWPAVRAQVPDAELHVFYALASWLGRAVPSPDEVGRRARYIEHALRRMTAHGVVVHDSVPNARMARELQSAACLIYPCEPVRYTEGFGCSVLDAAAGGCVPIISTADALPSVHGDASIGIVGSPAETREAWVGATVTVMREGASDTAKQNMRRHAEKHSRHAVTDQWESLIRGLIHARRGANQNQNISRQDISLR